ncbi:MAG: hypothetical protein JSV27_12085 [Candidatus Bathyarchaeota archaeon]|nr:MAG: hypothetical protein JSV27_12085 [Candidatus Bathyarchaeota archaeon]
MSKATKYPAALFAVATLIIALLANWGVIDTRLAFFLFVVALIMAAALSGKGLPYEGAKDIAF